MSGDRVPFVRRHAWRVRALPRDVRREIREWWRWALRAIPGQTGRTLRRVMSPARIGFGSKIFEHVIIYFPERLTVGADGVISAGSKLNAAGTIVIGDHVLIGPGCTLWSQNHRFASRHELVADQGYDLAPITIEDDVWLGANVTVLAGVTLRKGTIVAAGAVVTRSSSEYALLAGVPARSIGERAGVPPLEVA